MSLKEQLLQKINNNDVLIGILGLGYVGLPLAVTFAKNDMRVLGFDSSAEKTLMINEGRNYISDIDDDELRIVVEKKKLSATSDFSRIAECDVIIICVPTPLDEFGKPNMSHIEEACAEISKNMKRGVFISLESTTYPTTTEGLILTIMTCFSQRSLAKICFSSGFHNNPLVLL